MSDRTDARSPHGVGARVPLVDGASKVTGSAVYTDDIQLPGTLVGKILRSPHAHAKILRLDTSKAEAMPGVRAVIVGDEQLGSFGVLPISKDEVALAVGKVIYVGDCVAGVAADDEETALAALDAIAFAEVADHPVRSANKALARRHSRPECNECVDEGERPNRRQKGQEQAPAIRHGVQPRRSNIGIAAQACCAGISTAQGLTSLMRVSAGSASSPASTISRISAIPDRPQAP